MPPTSNLSKELGVDSPITKNREGVDLPLAYTYLLSYDNKSKKANCISVTKMAFDLQNMLFEYKSGFSITKIQLSITKMASQFTKWPLGLQVTFITFPVLYNLLKFYHISILIYRISIKRY